MTFRPMRSHRTPSDSFSASDSARTGDPASAATDTSTCRGVLRLLGAGVITGAVRCLDGDERQTDDDFPENIRFGDGW